VRARGDEVIATLIGELKKFLGNDDAYRMYSNIIIASVTAAVPVEARERLRTARDKRFSEDVSSHDTNIIRKSSRELFQLVSRV